MKAEESERDREFDERWERAKKVRVERSPGQSKTSVFSIKMERELLRLLVERAREMGIGTSTLARTLIAQGLVSEEHRLSDETLIELLKYRIKRKETATEARSSTNTNCKIKASKQFIIGSSVRKTLEPEEKKHKQGSTSYLSLTGS